MRSCSIVEVQIETQISVDHYCVGGGGCCCCCSCAGHAHWTVRYYRALLSVHSNFIAANWDACVWDADMSVQRYCNQPNKK